VGLEAGADAAAEFAAITGGLPGGTPAQWALRWVIQQPGVTTVIPGARNTTQARQNAEAASLPPLPQAELGAIEGLYDKYFRATVHDRW
jgi:aryl-alcohol dehydrogenase-like predicted oxidoreductase